MQIRNTILATAIALSIPYGVKAETAQPDKYHDYYVSCDTESACNIFDITYQAADNQVAQARRTRRTRSSSAKKLYAGASLGLIFEDFLDLGVQGGIFGGYKFNEYIGADAELTLGFAGYENVDETLTIFGFFLNPRFEYKFDGTNIAAFVSPGLGFGILSAFNDSDTEFGFQLKAGASFGLNDNLSAFAQVRFQDIEFYDPILLEGGVILDL